MNNVYKTLSDPDLIMKFNQRDREAYEEIYRRYSPRLIIHVKGMTKQDEVAKDIIQDVFMYLFIKMGELEVKVSLESFLYTCVRNRVLTWFRKNKLRSEYINNIAEYVNQGYNSVDATIREKELKAIIEHEIDRLPDKMKKIFEMSRKEYKSHQQIAVESDITVATVRKQIVNAIKILRSKISAFFFFSFMVAILLLNKYL